MSLLTPHEAAKYYGVSTETLRSWAEHNRIEVVRTEGGHRRYVKAEAPSKSEKPREHIIYARVSSKKQESDLARQIEYLRGKYPSYKVISDIGSGINCKRPGFRWILDEVFKGNIAEVVVAHSDRFSRLGSDLFQWIFECFKTELVVINTKDKTPNEDLADELLEIITVFTARYYGSRKYKNEEILDENDTIEILPDKMSISSAK